jgi:hypothetical protein
VVGMERWELFSCQLQTRLRLKKHMAGQIKLRRARKLS